MIMYKLRENKLLLLLVAHRATNVVDRWFFAHFFGRWRGQCTYTLIPMWLTCGGIRDFGKLGKFEKLQIFIKEVGSISGHIGSQEWQPS